MANPKRPEKSIDYLFNWILAASILMHAALFLLVMGVEPPPPPSQEEYASWLKKVTPPRIIEEVPPPPEVKEPEIIKEAEPEEVVKEEPIKARPKRVKPAERLKEVAKRAEVRKQLSGAGLLAKIGEAAKEGGLANVFESEAVVGQDLGAALAERGGVRVTGGARIGKKGALGAGTGADIGDVDVGVGGPVGDLKKGVGVVPKAFVKSTEAVLKKGGIDERGVQMALRRRERGIQQCYERSLKTNPKLKGRVVLEWGINELGRAVKVKVVQNTLGDLRVAECIKDIISRIRFPKASEGIVPVRKTFVFESG
jgi:hypothetical protein